MTESIDLSIYAYLEIILGLVVFWVSFYLLSRNPSSVLSWVVTGFLFGFGFTTFSEPILLYSRSLEEYVYWQNLTDWPLFFSPVFVFHASALIYPKKTKLNKYLINLGYFLAAVFYITDIKGGLVLQESVLRFTDYQRFDGFAPGILLIPSVLFTIFFLSISGYYYLSQLQTNRIKYLLPAIGSFFLALTGLFVLISYYKIIGLANVIFGFGTGLATLFYIYSMIKFHLFSPAEKYIFDKSFFYKTILAILILLLYWGAYKASGIPFNYNSLLFLIFVAPIIIFSHTFFEWVVTFINDLTYNPTSGFSVVNDQEVYDLLKNYNTPQKIEDSLLLRLRLIDRRQSDTIVSLRNLAKEAIDFFKPAEDLHRRTKQNLKYHLLKMLVFDQAEEGQMLWELGFDEYPVRIMSRENNLRKPLFEVKSPSDYTYTSRNAYLALKKEAIHDVTWRISYLEKLAKRKVF